MQERSSNFGLIVFCFFIIYFVWGSTYLANAWGLETLPPFFLAGFRFSIAGLLSLGYAALKAPLRLTKKEFYNTAFAGFMFFTIGNGFVVWGLQYVDSGMTALLIALQPLNIAILMWWMKSERLGAIAWIGLMVGLLGMYLLVDQPEFLGNREWIMGLIAILIGIGSWSYVSIYIADAQMPKQLIASAGWQMLFGSVFLFVISVAKGELNGFDFDLVSAKSWYSVIYLIIFGSIMAFTAFNYLLLRVSPTRVATAAYINPIVALFLGWWLNHEQLSSRSIIASSFLLGAVVLVNFGRKKKAKKTKA